MVQMQRGNAALWGSSCSAAVFLAVDTKTLLKSFEFQWCPSSLPDARFFKQGVSRDSPKIRREQCQFAPVQKILHAAQEARLGFEPVKLHRSPKRLRPIVPINLSQRASDSV